MKKKKKKRKVVEATISDLEDIPGETMRSKSLDEYNSSSPVSPASSRFSAFSDDDDGSVGSKPEVETLHSSETHAASAETSFHDNHLRFDDGGSRVDGEENINTHKPLQSGRQPLTTERLLNNSTSNSNSAIIGNGEISVQQQNHISKHEHDYENNSTVKTIHKENVGNSSSGDEVMENLPRNITNTQTSLNFLSINSNGDQNSW